MSLDKFTRAIEQATAEAMVDLPKVLAQWSQGQNPEHAKALRAIESLLAIDSNLDADMRAILEARAESMRPKLNWDRPTVALMVTLVLASKVHDHAVAIEVRDRVLRSKAATPGGAISGRGRKPGSTVERVEGVAEQVTITCSLCNQNWVKRANAVTSPANLGTFIRSHIAESHKVATSAKAFSDAVDQARRGTPVVLNSADGTELCTIGAVTVAAGLKGGDDGMVTSA